MENASKALLMAGGILIALLIVGALVLMFNQLSAYQKSNSDNLKTSQLVEFNNQFLNFTLDEEIYGYDLISLLNKVTNYNEAEPVANSVEYKEITLSIIMGKSFATKYGINNTSKAFGTLPKTYVITKSDSDFSKIINKFIVMEKNYTLSGMSKLSTYYDAIYVDKTKTIKEVLGKDVIIDKTDVEQYREYSEFKKAKFKNTNIEYYKNGQVKAISFEFVS